MTQRPVIHWFRRDLRMRDNVSLHHACESNAPVICLFVLDNALLTSPNTGKPRLKFLRDALSALDASLRDYGTQLIIRHGEPLAELTKLIAETDAAAVHFNRDYSPYAQKRDDAVAAALDIPVHIYDDAILLPPGSVMTTEGTPYRVFTPFKRRWNEQPKPEVSVRHFRPDWFYDVSELNTVKIDAVEALNLTDVIDTPPADEDTALKLLDDFVENRIQHYSDMRNALPINPFENMQEDGTSYLSPYLRLGLISPRQCYHAARDAYQATDNSAERKSIETWVSELTWREFYVHILHFFPHVLERDFVDTYQALAWRDDPDGLAAWQAGKTGYPIIDAPMRQLNAIGWMPNRARMIVASFLTKDLLIHWRHGEQYFMQHLIDGDPAANNGGWQWAAGTGTDAQPYFRIFNPVSQSKKYATPDYLRYWLPELKDVPDKYIHEPWKMDTAPASYPAPIVDHAAARERTLAAFKTARGEN